MLRSYPGRRAVLQPPPPLTPRPSSLHSEMATGGPDSPTALFLTRGDAPSASPGQDDEPEVSAVNQVATQTQLLEGEADPDVDDVVHQQVQVTSPQQQTQGESISPKIITM
ncbi:hypothetical protein B566_EDAN011496 [Ephemera danica]|nr:hypothetical protein B566_EDAN011496 [Ephemera danica]